MGGRARSVAFSPNGAHLAVGMLDGALRVLALEAVQAGGSKVPGSKLFVAERKDCSEEVNVLAYSPDGSKLVRG